MQNRPFYLMKLTKDPVAMTLLVITLVNDKMTKS